MSVARVWALPGLGGMGGLRAEFAAGTETPHPSHRKKQALPAVHPNSKPWRLGEEADRQIEEVQATIEQADRVLDRSHQLLGDRSASSAPSSTGPALEEEA